MKALIGAMLFGCVMAGAAVDQIQVIGGNVTRIAPAPDGTVYVSGPGFIDPTPGAYITRKSGDYVVHIDPRTWDILYATYVGFSTSAMALDSNGAVYVAGGSTILKLNPTGTRAEFSARFLSIFSMYSMVVGVDGSIYLTGTPSSTDFPTTPDALQRTGSFSTSGFFARLSPDASKILYATYLGGTTSGTPARGTSGHSLALDAQGNVHLAGLTSSLDFPVTPGAFSTPVPVGTLAVERAFFARWNASSNSFDYVGTVGFDVNLSARVFVAGDAKGRTVLASNTGNSIPVTRGALQPRISGPWVLMLNEAGTDLAFSTGLGIQPATISGLTLDDDGNPVVVGQSPNTPKLTPTLGAYRRSTPAVQEGFIGKLSASGQRLLYLTYLDITAPYGLFRLPGSNTFFVAGTSYTNGPGIDVHPSFPATNDPEQIGPRSTLYAMPNVVDLCSRPQATWLYWDTRDPGVEALEVHSGAPDGPLVASGLTGSIAVAPVDGATYFLQDVSGGKPLTPENTLATEQIFARFFEHCRAVADPVSVANANPNPVLACAEDAGFTGTQTTITVPGSQYWELHYGTPDGVQIASYSYSPIAYLGDWVTDSTDFFLTDGKGQSLASERVYVLPIRWCRLGAPTPPLITTRCAPSGATTLAWHAGVQPAEIRAGSPDGPVLARFDQAQGLFDPPSPGTYHLMGYRAGDWRPLTSVTVNGTGCGQ